MLMLSNGIKTSPPLSITIHSYTEIKRVCACRAPPLLSISSRRACSKTSGVHPVVTFHLYIVHPVP
jgi:hypothetical protein